MVAQYTVGTLELLIRQLLTHFIVVKKRFTLNLLNEHIAIFNYGPDMKNKPSCISKQHLDKGHLRQSGEPTENILFQMI